MHVKCYIYDLSKGMARAMSLPILGTQIDGIWHTSIVVFGSEYFYGGTGVEYCDPGQLAVLGPPDTICNLGETEVTEDLFFEYLSSMSENRFSGREYHLFNHNCNTFSNELAQFLTGNAIPSNITSLPEHVLSTPFGQMIKPFVDALTVGPQGAHSFSDSVHQP